MIGDYITKHTSPVSTALQQIERDTHVLVLGDDMISGAYQGKLLEMFSKMINPVHVLEVGTFTGFSAICLASGLREGGKVITIEHNDELEDIIRKNLAVVGVSDKVELRFGDAMTVLQTMSESDFDLIYLDADKERYAEYYALLIDKLRSGGFLIIDNVLWHGKITDISAQDKVTLLMRSFNDMVSSDGNVECVMLSVRDGLTIVRKN
ncbi:MAG: O-methyltransferase [Bacteroidales bacterium]|jgi:predicted O-methyltransferase YrrM|nr:O-methyltransferase [Bacteroidales bacterium]